MAIYAASKKRVTASIIFGLIGILVILFLVVNKVRVDVYDMSLKLNFGKAIVGYIVAMSLLFFAPTPMEIPFLRKLHIAIGLTLGSICIGFLGWVLIAPDTDLNVISFYGGAVGPLDAVIVLALAFLVAFVVAGISAPYCKEMGIAAVALGLAICAVRSGSLANVLVTLPDSNAVHSVYSVLRWEGIYWVMVISAGIAGSLSAEKYLKVEKDAASKDSGNNVIVIFPVLATIVIVYFGVMILGLCARTFDQKFFTLVRQPYNGQIGFAIFISFSLAGFACKHFLKSGYLYPILTTALVSFVFAVIAGKLSYVDYITKNHSLYFMAYPFAGMLPIQIVSFGTLGIITGYYYSVLMEKRHFEFQAD